MSDTKHRRASLFSLIFLMLVLTLVIGGGLHRQKIIDYVVGLQFRPSQSITKIHEKLDLTPDGTFYFNASQPSLEGAAAFNQSCKKQETNNPILGCYALQRIYIYDVQNRDLNGIEETTAAHELLHAAYERLSDEQKNDLNTLLIEEYQRIKTVELEKRMEYYKQSEPGEESNELHSILGTEISDLSPALEEHYANYFNNRVEIVGYYNQYNNMFIAAAKRISQLENEINSTVASINQRIQSYNAASSQLQADTQAFNTKSDNGGFSSQQDFDSQRGALLTRQSQLDQERTAINQSIETVRVLREEYDGEIARYNQLSKSINSTVAPTPTIR